MRELPRSMARGECGFVVVTRWQRRAAASLFFFFSSLILQIFLAMLMLLEKVGSEHDNPEEVGVVGDVLSEAGWEYTRVNIRKSQVLGTDLTCAKHYCAQFEGLHRSVGSCLINGKRLSPVLRR